MHLENEGLTVSRHFFGAKGPCTKTAVRALCELTRRRSPERMPTSLPICTPKRCPRKRSTSGAVFCGVLAVFSSQQLNTLSSLEISFFGPSLQSSDVKLSEHQKALKMIWTAITGFARIFHRHLWTAKVGGLPQTALVQGRGLVVQRSSVWPNSVQHGRTGANLHGSGSFAGRSRMGTFAAGEQGATSSRRKDVAVALVVVHEEILKTLLYRLIDG